MICKYCGKEIDDKAEKCLYCGQEQYEQNPKREENVNSIGKHTLYKAAQAAPERPSTLEASKKSDKGDNSKKKRIIAGIVMWLIVIGIVVGGGYAIGSIFKNPSSSSSEDVTKEGTVDPEDIPDVPEIVEEDTNTSAETEDDTQDEEEQKTVNFPVLGAWQWSSDNNGYKDTVWVFDDLGSITVYYIGAALYDYSNWPTTYEYDDSTGILNIKGGAFHLVWENENQFAIGQNVAIKVDESVIPDSASIVNGKDAPASEDEKESETDNTNDGSGDETEEISDYIFPESNSRYLTSDDCKGMTADEIRIGRNEIFARHGWIFESEELKEYFESKDWYNGYISAKNFSNSVLNKYERANITFLKNMEDSM